MLPACYYTLVPRVFIDGFGVQGTLMNLVSGPLTAGAWVGARGMGKASGPEALAIEAS